MVLKELKALASCASETSDFQDHSDSQPTDVKAVFSTLQTNKRTTTAVPQVLSSILFALAARLAKIQLT